MSITASLLWAGPRISEAADPSEAIARILGPRRWSHLPEAVRRRFGTHDRALYRGAMKTTLSPVGRLFAWALAPVGTPLPLVAGDADAAVEVRPFGGGMAWSRVYRGPFGIPFAVRSIKRLSDDGRLLECCAGGWTMLLDVDVEQGALVFRSRRFFWRLGPLSIPIALPLTPGQAEIRHEDRGNGEFRFALTFTHPWAGRTLHQEGIFHDPGDAHLREAR